MIKIKHRGSFRNLEKFMRNADKETYLAILEKYGRIGCQALASATPSESGETAASWSYQIEKTSSGYSVVWTNGNVHDGVNIAIILQYGHGTGTGGYVQGRDYINPALGPVFEGLARDAWKEIMSA